MMIVKTCECCEVEKPLQEFGERVDLKDGHSPICIECKIYAEMRNKKKNWERHTIRTYQKDEIDYYAQLAIQGGGCDMCGKSEEENGQHLNWDHCHIYGYIRGLLCSDCNLGLGCIGDTLHAARAAVAYLERVEIAIKQKIEDRVPIALHIDFRQPCEIIQPVDFRQYSQ